MPIGEPRQDEPPPRIDHLRARGRLNVARGAHQDEAPLAHEGGFGPRRGGVARPDASVAKQEIGHRIARIVAAFTAAAPSRILPVEAT